MNKKTNLYINYKCVNCGQEVLNVIISYYDIKLTYDNFYLYVNKTVTTKCPYCEYINTVEIS
jgi:DNA-directed RNA polymerase subunit RPC12/RpoP